MKQLFIATIFALALGSTISAPQAIATVPKAATTNSSLLAMAATRAKCTGDAARSNPPIVNYPTHIRNVIWRNTRAICLPSRAKASISKLTFNKPDQDGR